MANERSSIINIGGAEHELLLTTKATKEIAGRYGEHELLLTTKATKEIAGRYGGLENLGDKLMSSDNFEQALGEIIWLITLLANQSILIYNIKNKATPKDLLTEEEVEILTTPHDLTEYKSAITEALFKGTQRNVESETDSKNATVG